MDADGEKLDCLRIANDPWVMLEEVAKAGPDAEVVIEATYGWYWAVDLLRDAGFSVHLSHPSGNDWGNRRVKNDERDARDLADLLRLGRLAEAWIAPPTIRELRELVRYRAKLVQLRSGLKSQVHAVMAKEGVLPALIDMFGPGGQRHLDEMQLADAYTVRVESLRDLIEVYNREVTMLERKIHTQLRDDRGYRAIQALTGVGRTIAAIFVAEIGDVGRFRSAEALCSWAGLTPRHRESDTKVVRTGISKMGSRLVRWAALEAVAAYKGGPQLKEDFDRIAERRGTNKARVAVARKLLTLVYYGLRDGEIRCLRDNGAVAA
jgi:transposase